MSFLYSFKLLCYFQDLKKSLIKIFYYFLLPFLGVQDKSYIVVFFNIYFIYIYLFLFSINLFTEK